MGIGGQEGPGPPNGLSEKALMHIHRATTHGDMRSNGARTPCTCLHCAVPQRRPEMKESPRQCSPVKRGQLRVITTVAATDAAGGLLPGGCWEEGTWGSRWSRGQAGLTLSAPRKLQLALATAKRPHGHHLPEGDPDILHSLSRAMTPWQILGPRTQKSSLEG